MAGHSHAKNVRITKEKNDRIKAKRNTMLGRALLVAAAGNPDPRTNAKLEAEIKRVKSMGLPKENIERVLKTASKSKEGKKFSQVIYYAHGNKVAFVIIVETDNQFSALEGLIKLPINDVQSISREFKNSWALAEGIRDSFKILVNDFIASESKRIRLGIYIR